MDFRFTPEQDSWRLEVREAIDALMTREVKEELKGRPDLGPGIEQKKFMEGLGKKGLLGISWPVEYLSLIHIRRCRRIERCRSRRSPYQ